MSTTNLRKNLRHTVVITDALGITTSRHFKHIDPAEMYAAEWTNLPGVEVTIAPYRAA